MYSCISNWLNGLHHSIGMFIPWRDIPLYRSRCFRIESFIINSSLGKVSLAEGYSFTGRIILNSIIKGKTIYKISISRSLSLLLILSYALLFIANLLITFPPPLLLPTPHFCIGQTLNPWADWFKANNLCLFHFLAIIKISTGDLAGPFQLRARKNV